MSIWSARIMSIGKHGIANMIGLSQEHRSIVRARRRNGSMRLTRPNPRIVNARTTWWPVRPEDRWSFGCFWRTRRVWWCSSFFWRCCTEWSDFFYSVFTSYSYRLAVVLFNSSNMTRFVEPLTSLCLYGVCVLICRCQGQCNHSPTSRHHWRATWVRQHQRLVVEEVLSIVVEQT